ncbi:MAG: hypothetical protein DHS20C15_25410 [Planctomycetota bacterium]|nr:MAG: hypothetical protein DHS20C15_25410 [Planctomycetota bacterium]
MSAAPDRREFVERARSLLGELSAEWVARPEVTERMRARLAEGVELDNIVLAEVAQQARQDARLYEEFMAYTMAQMRVVGRGSLAPNLRRFLDTFDLVQSVAGDVFADSDPPEFETKAAFLSLLRQRMRWKAADHARRLSAEKRSENRRDARDLEDLNVADRGEDPAAAGERADFLARLMKELEQLNKRDQQLLRMFLRGCGTDEIAERFKLSRETARRILARAKDRLRARFE